MPVVSMTLIFLCLRIKKLIICYTSIIFCEIQTYIHIISPGIRVISPISLATPHCPKQKQKKNSAAKDAAQSLPRRLARLCNPFKWARKHKSAKVQAVVGQEGANTRSGGLTKSGSGQTKRER